MTQLFIPRNVELLLKLVAQGALPPEAQPPLNIAANPTFIFTTWLDKLPQPIKNMVLIHITECNLEKQFLKVSKNWCAGLRVP